MKLYTIQELAAATGNPYNRIWRWVKRGYIQTVRDPTGKPLITEEEVNRVKPFLMREM